MTTSLKNTRAQLFFDLALFALLWLAFLQLLTTFIEATYTFGLLGTSIPPEIAAVLFLLTPLLLVPFPRLLAGRAGRVFALVTGAGLLLCRAASLLADTRGQMLLAGLGVGLFLLCLPALLRQARQPAAPLALGGGLAAAALVSGLLRALSSGSDLPFVLPQRLAGLGLALLGLALLLAWARPRRAGPEPSETGENPRPAGFGRAAVLCLGLASAFTLVYFAFASPVVIARWTGAGYPPVNALAALAAALVTGLWLAFPRLRAKATPAALAVWNLLFIVTLAAALRASSIAFPCCAGAYPLDALNPGPLAGAWLVGMLVLHPVIYLDAGLLGAALSGDAVRPRALAAGLAVGAFYLLVIIFAQVFTTTYDYIPVIGPWFRDQFWLVVSLPALVMLLALPLAAGPLRHSLQTPFPARAAAPRFAVLLALLAGASAALAFALDTRPVPAPGATSLRVLTYNIQQGVSQNGQKAYDGQLALIRAAGPDIIGLQETDTARIAGGNSDVVGYLAGQLHMYAYYGPKTTTGTFGIALLSRYPIQNPRTFFMYSQGEQTAAILAEIATGGRTFTVLVTHLGNGGPLVQQQQVLSRLAGRENVVAMGDFNFNPSSEQYHLTTTPLADGWELAGAKESGSLDLSRRIDHIFLSPGARVSRASYLPEGPSDHPALLVEIDW